MTTDEQAGQLREMHAKAPDGDKSLHMTLFAIKYADELVGHSLSEISALAGLGKSGPQLALGRKLARHVVLK